MLGFHHGPQSAPATTATTEGTTSGEQRSGDGTQFSNTGTIPPVATGAAGGSTPPTASALAFDGAAAATDPTTLAAVLAKNSYAIDAIQQQPWMMESVAQQLLQAKGIDSPTKSQISETVFKMGEAIKANTWETFTAPFSPQALKTEDNVNQRLGNLYYEKAVFSPDELKPENLKLNDQEKARLHGGGYESGVSGQVLAAGFINTHSRSEGDFSHAYGDDAWKNFIKAQTYLDSIPQGQFLQQLNLDVMIEVNRLIHTPDEGLMAKVLRTAAMIGRGGKWDKGGDIREGRQFAHPEEYSAAEMENMREAGVHVNQLTHHDDGGGKAMLEYPKPEEVKPGLARIIDELKADLALPNADPIGAASKFQRHFVALHPFGDSNGRTSRILMNRILSEFDMPPAIFADQNRDVSLSPEEWRTEVAKGVARSKKVLDNGQVSPKDSYLATMGISAEVMSPDQPITLGGQPFDLGKDGLLYDPTGRPWMLENNDLVPLAQLEQYVMSRRLLQMGKEAGTARLEKITEATRALYYKVAADASAGKDIVVRDDAAARKADAKYKLAPSPEVAKLLTELTDLGSLDASALFSVKGANGTAVSSTASKYSQIDLEFWYLEKGLREQGYEPLVEEVRAHRAKLFDMAKAAIEKSKDATRVSPENPNGFRFKYEKMMFDSSPLRFGSFDEAIKAEGDKQVTVWRGDYSFARVIGMAPNNDIRQPDAKAIAKGREKHRQLTNVYDDLSKLEGSAVGSQYICTTSDLALLVRSFANSQNGQTVNLSMLPALLRQHVLAWIDPNHEGMTDAQKTELRDTAVERGDAVVPGPSGGKEIKDTLGIPGTIVTVTVVDKAAGKIHVTANRKAFKVVLDKAALLPGVYALGGPMFEAEQEMHGLERVNPWDIKATYTAESLGQEFPVTGAAPADPTTATAAPTGPTQ